MPSHPSTLLDIADAVADSSTEVGQRNAVAKILLRQLGYADMPEIRSGTTQDGFKVRVYTWRNIPRLGDVALVTGPAVDAQVLKVPTGQGVYLEGAPVPEPVRRMEAKRAQSGIRKAQRTVSPDVHPNRYNPSAPKPSKPKYRLLADLEYGHDDGAAASDLIASITDEASAAAAVARLRARGNRGDLKPQTWLHAPLRYSDGQYVLAWDAYAPIIALYEIVDAARYVHPNRYNPHASAPMPFSSVALEGALDEWSLGSSAAQLRAGGRGWVADAMDWGAGRYGWTPWKAPPFDRNFWLGEYLADVDRDPDLPREQSNPRARISGDVNVEWVDEGPSGSGPSRLHGGEAPYEPPPYYDPSGPSYEMPAPAPWEPPGGEWTTEPTYPEPGHIPPVGPSLTDAQKLEWQDVLDSMYSERIVAVRNALRALGWETGADDRYMIKDTNLGWAKHHVTFETEHAGAGRNVVSVTWIIDDGKLGSIVDDRTIAPEGIAEWIDIQVAGAAVGGPAPEPTIEEPYQAPEPLIEPTGDAHYDAALAAFIAQEQAKLQQRLSPENYIGADHRRKYSVLFSVRPPGQSRSAIWFVDKKTGDVFKAASWKQAAPGRRGTIYPASGAELEDRAVVASSGLRGALAQEAQHRVPGEDIADRINTRLDMVEDFIRQGLYEEASDLLRKTEVNELSALYMTPGLPSAMRAVIDARWSNVQYNLDTNKRAAKFKAPEIEAAASFAPTTLATPLYDVEQEGYRTGRKGEQGSDADFAWSEESPLLDLTEQEEAGFTGAQIKAAWTKGYADGYHAVALPEVGWDFFGGRVSSHDEEQALVTAINEAWTANYGGKYGQQPMTLQAIFAGAESRAPAKGRKKSQVARDDELTLRDFVFGVLNQYAGNLDRSQSMAWGDIHDALLDWLTAPSALTSEQRDVINTVYQSVAQAVKEADAEGEQAVVDLIVNAAWNALREARHLTDLGGSHNLKEACKIVGELQNEYGIIHAAADYDFLDDWAQSSDDKQTLSDIKERSEERLDDEEIVQATEMARASGQERGLHAELAYVLDLLGTACEDEPWFTGYAPSEASLFAAAQAPAYTSPPESPAMEATGATVDALVQAVREKGYKARADFHEDNRASVEVFDPGGKSLGIIEAGPDYARPIGAMASDAKKATLARHLIEKASTFPHPLQETSYGTDPAPRPRHEPAAQPSGPSDAERMAQFKALLKQALKGE